MQRQERVNQSAAAGKQYSSETQRQKHSDKMRREKRHDKSAAS